MFKTSATLTADYWLVVSLVLLAIITLLSLAPLPELPQAPGGDKLHHLIAYSSLAFPVALKGGPKLLAVLLFYIAWGGGIELLQPYVNRYGEWLDFVVNSVGVFVGAGFGLIVRASLKQNLRS